MYICVRQYVCVNYTVFVNSVNICNNDVMTMNVYMYIGQRRSVRIQQKLEITELFNEMKRFQEEQQLLIKEMKNYIHYYYDVMLPSLSKDIAGIYVPYMYVHVHHKFLYMRTYAADM